MKVLNAALWGLMHSGTRFPCWCSVMKRWINSEIRTERKISVRGHMMSVCCGGGGVPLPCHTDNRLFS